MTKYTDGDEIKKWALWVDTIEHALQPELNTVVTYEGSNISVTKDAIYIDHEAYKEGAVEIAPRYWIPQKIEGQSLQPFWASFTRSSSPPSLKRPKKILLLLRSGLHSGLDTTSMAFLITSPFLCRNMQWIRQTKPTKFIKLITASGRKTEHYRPMYDSDGKMRKRKNKKNKGRKPPRGGYCEQPGYPPVNSPPRAIEAPTPQFLAQNFEIRSYNLTTNVYLWVAKPADDRQMADIYNHYVTHTIQAAEMRPIPTAVMAGRRDAANANNFRCIVAVEKTNGWHNAGRCGGPSLLSMDEKIVGYAMADNFTTNNSMYRYSAEMEIFVHPYYRRKGIGSALLDRMVFLLDPEHKISVRAEWREREVEMVVAGGIRIIQNISVPIPYAAGKQDERERMQWMITWLKSFGFDKKGEYEGMGVKLGNSVNLALFQKRTGASVDPCTAI